MSESSSLEFPEDRNVQFVPSGTPAPPPPYLSSTEAYGQPSAGRTPNSLEVLVAIFFFVAAAWLLVAVFYALLALLVLRLRARGRLNLHNDEFGRFYMCGTRFYFPCGCILRRYVVAFGHHQTSRRSRSTTYRYVSRSERRSAIREILLGTGKLKSGRGGGGGREKTDADKEIASRWLSSQTSEYSIDDQHKTPRAKARYATPSDNCHNQSSEELVCFICLAEYNVDDNIFKAEVCDHIYHSHCILDWLERRSNTDCPCCRQPLVSEEEVWEAVLVARKSKQQQAKKEKKQVSCWQLASMNSELTVPCNNSCNVEPGSGSSPDNAPNRHHSTFSLPTPAWYSRPELTAESEEYEHSDTSAAHGLPESVALEHSSSCGEAVPPFPTEEVLGTRSNEDTLSSKIALAAFGA